MTTAGGFATASLSDIERAGDWTPIRRHFGIQAFGVNAWHGGEPGANVIGEHDEVPTGHEELYLVLAGAARFTVDGETIDAAAGTVVFVGDPAVKRGAEATEAGTTILAVGAKPGAAFTPNIWEENASIIPLFNDGAYAEAKERLLTALEEHPDAAGLLYNLACAESRLGELDAAVEHLARAVAAEPQFAGHAQDDPDLEAIRGRDGFPPAPS